jgi:glyceraldehyde 3-phosphate dehydrogenase
MVAKVAINGLGRIGRATLKIVMDTPRLDLVAANELASIEDVRYLLTHDTVYGRYDKTIVADGQDVVIGGKRVTLLHEKNPTMLPWRSLGVDIRRRSRNTACGDRTLG